MVEAWWEGATSAPTAAGTWRAAVLVALTRTSSDPVPPPFVPPQGRTDPGDSSMASPKYLGM